MSDANWKRAERRVAQIVGGRRIGNGGHGGEDVEHDRLSLEVKHRKKIPALIVSAYDQARRNAGGKVPVVVLHAAGSPRYMAVLELADLVDLIDVTDSSVTGG